LRRASIGVLRTMLERGFDLRLSDAFHAAYDGYAHVKLDVPREELQDKIGDFFTERLRGLLTEKLPTDAVAASLAVAAGRPTDARAGAGAISALDAETRARVGEVFKRATNIGSDAPQGDPAPPLEGAHPSEIVVHRGFMDLRAHLDELTRKGDYPGAFRE